MDQQYIFAYLLVGLILLVLIFVFYKSFINYLFEIKTRNKYLHAQTKLLEKVALKLGVSDNELKEITDEL